MTTPPSSTLFPAGPEIDPELLARIPLLPLKPAPVELLGPRVRLVVTEPERDAAPLFAMSNGKPITLGKRSIGDYDTEMLVWKYMRYGPFDDIAACAAYLAGIAAP